MRPLHLTEEQLTWLRENFPYLPNYECRTHLHISEKRLKMLAGDMGLVKVDPRKTKVAAPSTKPQIWYDADAPGGYCQDCVHYLPDAVLCAKGVKDIGALWVKKCYKGEVKPPHPKQLNNIMNTKVCSRCKRELPVSRFGKNSRMKDGYQPLCHECKSEVSRKGGRPKKDNPTEESEPKELK